MPNTAHNSDDLPCLARELDRPADGIFIWKHFPDQRVIEDAGPWRIGRIIALGKVASAQQGNAHGAEVMTGNKIVAATIAKFRLVDSPFDTDGAAERAAAHWCGRGLAGSLDSRQCFKTSEQLVQKKCPT